MAITYHRSLRSKALSDSVLDKIEGIGEKRKKELLKHFKSIDRIKKATVEELLEVNGISADIANKIHDFFK